MKHDIYFLYSDPTEGSRTGHAAIAVTRGGEMVRYFSMYHAWLPDQIRQLSITARLTALIPSSFVTAYEDDVVMRGQSYVRFQRKEKENITVPNILSALPNLDETTRALYFNHGQFHHTLKLSDNVIDPYALIEMLDEMTDIRNNVSWTMFSPLTSFFFNQKSYNCCSAIERALSVSKKDESRSALPAMMIARAFLAVYVFAFYGMRSANEENVAPLHYLPLLYPLFLVIQSLYHAHRYVSDLTAMAKKDGPDFITLSLVYLLCATINVLGSPFSKNACHALFVFPNALARSISAMPSAQKLTELPMMFTRVTTKAQREEIKAQSALAA